MKLHPSVRLLSSILCFCLFLNSFQLSAFAVPYPVEGDHAQVIVGDIDDSGEINTSDARMILQLALNTELVTSNTLLTAADVDDDFAVSTTDVRKMLLYLCGELKWYFPIGTMYITKDMNYKEKGTNEYEDQMALLILDAVNELRIEEGTTPATWLPGVADYSKIRSEQLITDFSHNEEDQKYAAEVAEFGCRFLYKSGDYFFRPATSECITGCGKDWTDPRDAAMHIAKNFQSSRAGHWMFVGGEDYTFMSIGVTYANNVWAVCVDVSETYHDGGYVTVLVDQTFTPYSEDLSL